MITHEAKLINAIVIHPFLKSDTSSDDKSVTRSPTACLDEAIGLAGAIFLNVTAAEIVKLSAINAATYIGSGTVNKINSLIKAHNCELAILNCHLSPMQQRNLERLWNTKVIDRTALILEIFGERAKTKEGILQVELAHLSYQKSRLVRSWTHLERQRGGSGFLGGPGETQLEMDKRNLSDKIVKIKKELETVKRTRHLHRKSRQQVPYPIIALVGYTNAGKSTLFNTITKAGVLAKNQLFATLDPTMRQITLPKGTKVILSDTVGFISNLPTELIAAFRATLEEVEEADIILHIRDYIHPDSYAQKQDVLSVLKSLDIETEPSTENKHHIIEVLNKIDMLPDNIKQGMLETSKHKDSSLCISALTGEGQENLMTKIEEILSLTKKDLSLKIKPENGKLLSWIYKHSDVVSRKDNETVISLHLKMEPFNIEKLKNLLQDTTDNTETQLKKDKNYA